MDPYSLMCDYEGVNLGLSVGDFIPWLMSRCGRCEARQLFAEFVVENSLGHRPSHAVIASDDMHRFTLAGDLATAILCDFPIQLEEALHLDKWTFFAVDASSFNGSFTADELAAVIPQSLNYYTLCTIGHA